MGVTAAWETRSASELSLAVTDPDGTRSLWFRADGPTWDVRPETLDAAAVALVHHASRAGEDLHLDGPVHRSLLERLDELLRIWVGWRPDLFRHVELTATEELPPVAGPAPGTSGAVMGFSGGVDACFALAAHQSGALGRLSHRVDRGVLVIGWDVRHGDDTGRARAAAAVREQLSAYDVRTSVVATNWKDDFCPAWFMSFNTGLTGLLHTFAGEHSAAVHATDHCYRNELNMPPYGSHMAINHLLGHAGFPVLSTGGTHSRLERVGFLADHPQLLRGLRVCYQEGAAGENCGHCEKCVRTQLELYRWGIAADGLFPSPMVPADLDRARVTNPTVIQHFVDIAAGLPDDDPWREPVLEWVRARRLEHARRRNLPAARVADLEAEVAAQAVALGAKDAELDALRRRVADLEGSTSWRLTRPLRDASDVVRRRR